MSQHFQYDVFLSHSTKDTAVVRDVAERLRGDGLRVWLDEWEIRPGDSIPAKIEAGLEHSRVLVLCMSAHAFGCDPGAPGLESGTIRFRDPLNQRRRFIPLRLDDASIKGSLTQFLADQRRGSSMNRELKTEELGVYNSGIRPVARMRPMMKLWAATANFHASTLRFDFNQSGKSSSICNANNSRAQT